MMKETGGVPARWAEVVKTFDRGAAANDSRHRPVGGGDAAGGDWHGDVELWQRGTPRVLGGYLSGQ